MTVDPIKARVALIREALHFGMIEAETLAPGASRFAVAMMALDELDALFSEPAWRSEPATDDQLRKIARECDDRALPQPTYDQLTRGDAVRILDQLRAGTYDAERWVIPF